MLCFSDVWLCCFRTSPDCFLYVGYSKLQLGNGFRNGLLNKLVVETECALSPWCVYYTLLQWEYLRSLILSTVYFDTKKALLSYESHRTGRYRKKNWWDGHNSLQGRRCYHFKLYFNDCTAKPQEHSFPLQVSQSMGYLPLKRTFLLNWP